MTHERTAAYPKPMRSEELMRFLIVVGVVFTTLGCAVRIPPALKPQVATEEPLFIPDGQRRSMFCFIDGRTARCDDLVRFGADAIDNITLFRGHAALQRYGPEAKEGAIVVSTKPSAVVARPPADPAGNVFYFIDGRTTSRFDLERLSPDSIQSISLLRGAAATTRFGPEAATGAVVVFTKRNR